MVLRERPQETRNERLRAREREGDQDDQQHQRYQDTCQIDRVLADLSDEIVDVRTRLHEQVFPARRLLNVELGMLEEEGIGSPRQVIPVGRSLLSELLRLADQRRE